MDEIPVTHALKCVAKYFHLIESGLKTFEVRKNDRGFKVNDFMLLHLYNPDTLKYSTRHIMTRITYILDTPDFCKEGYIIIGFVKMKETPNG